MSIILAVSFCNVDCPGLVLGALDFESDRFEYVKWPDRGEAALGIDGLRVDGEKIWAILQLPNGKSALALLDHALQIEKEWLLTEIGDVHDISVYPGGLLLTDTANNRIVSCSYDDLAIGQIETRYSLAEAGSDVLHINSIATLGSDVIVSLFGQRTDGGWWDARQGEIRNLTSDTILAGNLFHPHSVTVRNDEIWWLESRSGSVHRWTRERGPEVFVKLDGYLRGLCFSGDFMFIGASALRRRSKSTGVMNTMPTDNSGSWQSWVYRVELLTRSHVRRCLTPLGSEIFGLQILNRGRAFLTGSNAEGIMPRIWKLQDLGSALRVQSKRNIGYKETIDEVRRLIDSGDLRFARERAQTFLEEWDVFGEALYLNAFLKQITNGDAAEVEQLYRLSLAHGFDEFWVRYNLATLLAESGRLTEAEVEAGRAAELNPAHSHAQVQLDGIRKRIIEKNRREVASLIEAGEHAKALPIIRQLLHREPEWSEGCYLLALCLERSKDGSIEAVDAIRRCLAHGGDSGPAKNLLIRLLLLSGKIEEALTELRLLNTAYPNDSEVRKQLQNAEGIWLASRKESALQDLSLSDDSARRLCSILEEDSAWTEGRIALARILYDLGKPEEALEQLNALTLPAARSGEAHGLRALIFRALNQIEKSIEEIDCAITHGLPGATSFRETLAEECSNQYLAQAKSIFDSGSWNSAIQHVRRALAYRQSSEGCLLLANALDHLNAHKEEALLWYNRALEAGADPFEVHTQVSALYFEQGDLQQAKAEALLALALRPDDFGSLQILYGCLELNVAETLTEARRLVNSSRLAEAEQLLSPLVDAETREAEAYYLLGCCFAWSGKDYGRGVSLFGEARQLGFDEYWCCYNRGVALHAMGDRDGARGNLERALVLKPGSAEIMRRLKEWGDE